MPDQPRVTITLTVESDAAGAHRMFTSLLQLADASPESATCGHVHSWRAVAVVLGVSEDTVLRARRRAGVLGDPASFESAAAVRAWWDALISPQRPSTQGPTLSETRGGRHGR